MNISLKDFNQILIKTKREKQPEILRFIFSFKSNIDLFAYYMFPDIITKKTPSFHYELYDMLFRNGNDAYAAPRGHAKSTTCGLVFISFCIVNNLEKYIIYISQSHSKTVQFISPLRNAFKRNDRIKFVYGDLNPRNSKDIDGRDREDCIDVNGVRIEAVSFEKNMRGFNFNNQRPTLIVLDDIEDDERVLNPDLRKKDLDKLNKAIINSLAVDGKYKFIGTILHVNSALLNKIKLLKGKIYKAIDSNGNLLFPELYDKNKLEKIKTEIGSLAFQQEFLNDPTDNESSLIKREWILNSFDSSISLDECSRFNYDIKVLGVDFAFSDRVTADKSAFVSLGFKEEKFYIFQGSTKKGMSIYEQMDYIKNGLHVAFKYKIIALEENSIKAVSKDLDSFGLPIKLYWTASSDPAEKKKEDNFRNKRTTVGKINMITRLGTAFENGLIVIPYKTDKDKIFANSFLDEITSWALQGGKLVESGVHPDIPMAMGFAYESIKDYGGNELVFFSAEV